MSRGKQSDDLSGLEDLIRDGDEVNTTVVEIGKARIEVSTKNDLSLITVSSFYSREIAREVQRLALKCPGSLGLEFKDIRAATPRVYDTSVLSLLKNLRLRTERRGKAFFLCHPPPKLVDFLKLSGVHEAYLQSPTDAKPIDPVATTMRRRPRRSDLSLGQKQEARKRIFQLNESLKRTVSLEKGLDSAEKCVKKLLPQEPPRAEGYSFAFSYRSSEKVGGDFFDFVWQDSDHLAISLGDVSGHGVDAALVMGITKKLINVRAKDPRYEKPSDLLRQINQDLKEDLNPQTFVTALYGVFDVRRGTFQFCRAGHEFPILFFPGREQLVLKSSGVALGLAPDRYFKSQAEDIEVRMAPGACLLLCTDGIAECRNEKEAIFSRDRLVFELEQIDGEGAASDEILDRILSVVRSFAGKRSQEDDMTAILLQRLPVANSRECTLSELVPQKSREVT